MHPSMQMQLIFWLQIRKEVNWIPSEHKIHTFFSNSVDDTGCARNVSRIPRCELQCHCHSGAENILQHAFFPEVCTSRTKPAKNEGPSILRSFLCIFAFNSKTITVSYHPVTGSNVLGESESHRISSSSSSSIGVEGKKTVICCVNAIAPPIWPLILPVFTPQSLLLTANSRSSFNSYHVVSLIV